MAAGQHLDAQAPGPLPLVAPRALGGRAVITGASGFIGRRLIAALEAGGTEVITLRRAGSPEPKTGRSAVVDYADVDSLADVLERERPEWLFHVAGTTKGVKYEDFQRGNVMPTQHLLDALGQVGHAPQRFVHVSSLAAYGPSKIGQPHDEANERRPVEHYGRSKLEAEQVVEAARVPWTIIRPGGVYGPGDVDYFEYFKLAHRGMNVFFGNRRRWTSMVYVDDVVRAIIDAAGSAGAANRGYFICDGEPVSFEDFQAGVVAASGRTAIDLDLPELLVSVAATWGELLTSLDKKPRLFNHQKATMGKQEAWTCSHARARADFGYRPTVSRADGVRLTFAWYRSAGWL